jgi:hypothetical protein
VTCSSVAVSYSLLHPVDVHAHAAQLGRCMAAVSSIRPAGLRHSLVWSVLMDVAWWKCRCLACLVLALWLAAAALLLTAGVVIVGVQIDADRRLCCVCAIQFIQLWRVLWARVVVYKDHIVKDHNVCG